MFWIALAIIFCFLMWKWPRTTLIGLSVCVGICLAAFGVIWGMLKYQDYKKTSLIDDLQISVQYQVFPGDYAIAKHETREEYLALVNGKWEPATKKKCSFNDMMSNMTQINTLKYAHKSMYNKHLKEFKKLDNYDDCYEIYVNGKFFTNRLIREINKCHHKEAPMAITITNHSNEIILRTDFTIEAFEAGRSTNLVEFPTGDYYSDNILNPGESIELCYRAPSLSGLHDLPLLDWRVYATNAKTK